jgi:mannosylglycerate hydrolase
VTPDGVLLLTVLRAVGWLARFDLRSRPIPAGPAMETPGAQMLGPFGAEISLIAGLDPTAAFTSPIGLCGVVAGPAPLLPDGASLLRLDPPLLLLTAVKPAENGKGIVVRVLNPSSQVVEAVLSLGFPLPLHHEDWIVRPVRLNEDPAEFDVRRSGKQIRFEVPPRALRTIVLDRIE